MHPMGDTRRHFFLTLGMAEACGVDLGVALREGRISEAEYARMITRCRGCDQPDRCAALAATGAARALAPDFCVNQATLARLAERHLAVA